MANPKHSEYTTLHAIEAGLDEDLSALSAMFWQQGIAHRIYERQGRQVLELKDETHLAHVRSCYQKLREGSLVLKLERSKPSTDQHALLRTFRELPIFSVVAGIAIVAFPIALNYLGMGRWFTALSFATPANVIFSDPWAVLLATLQANEWWRLITPAFLHFSLIHIGFNLAIMYEFGRRLEPSIAAIYYLPALLAMAAISNAAQFLVVGHASFGGLSGVVYGLFGALVVLGLRYPQSPELRLRSSFIIMIFAFLVLFSTGVTEQFGLNIANTAHWAGFVVGVAFGACVPVRANRGAGA